MSIRIFTAWFLLLCLPVGLSVAGTPEQEKVFTSKYKTAYELSRCEIIKARRAAFSR